MHADDQLTHIEAEDLLSEIRKSIVGQSSTNRVSGAVCFYPFNISNPPMTFLSQAPLKKMFGEDDYLRSNPEVAAALQSGKFPSGVEHWIKYQQYQRQALPMERQLKQANETVTSRTIESQAWERATCQKLESDLDGQVEAARDLDQQLLNQADVRNFSRKREAGVAGEVTARELLTHELWNVLKQFEQLQVQTSSLRRYSEQLRSELVSQRRGLPGFLRKRERACPKRTRSAANDDSEAQ